MTSNYDVYAIPKTVEDPGTECIEWFWITLGEDNVYDKEFLEYLMQMSEDVRTGKIETIPYSREMFDELDDLVGDLIEDD
jgi:hypothetical protein